MVIICALMEALKVGGRTGLPAAVAGPAQLPGTVISSCWCVAFVGSEHKIFISFLVTIIRYSSLQHEGNTIIPLVTVMK